MNLKKESVRQLALEAGFKLRQQPDGTEDLNPYVYTFADKLAATVAEDFLVMMRITYDELGEAMQKLDNGDFARAMLCLRRLRQAMEELV